MTYSGISGIFCPKPPTREGLAHISLIRREELDGFVEGLFGAKESLELPERAHRAMNALSEMRAIFDGLHELAGNPAKPISADDIPQTRRNIRELTKIGEREIHTAVLYCARQAAVFRGCGYLKTKPALIFGGTLPEGSTSVAKFTLTAPDVEQLRRRQAHHRGTPTASSGHRPAARNSGIGLQTGRLRRDRQCRALL
jgi:hypothetical protein